MTDKLSSSVTSTSNASFHNDRRRRDNINERIQELLEMIPDELFDSYYARAAEGNTPGQTPGSSSATPGASSSDAMAAAVAAAVAAKPRGSGTRDGKPNKGQILTQTVEFITLLQNSVDSKNREEMELIAKVKHLSKKTGTIVNDIDLEHTSAEVELSRIGVGPLAQGAVQQPPKQHNQGYEYGGYSEYRDTA